MSPLSVFKKIKEDERRFSRYPTPTPPETQQVIKRPLTDSDRGFMSKYYQSRQNRLRVLAILSFGLLITNTIILSNIMLDWTVSFILYFFMFIIGVIALGQSLKTILIRKRISDTLQEGTVIEAQGLAYKNRTTRNTATWTVGPISMMSTVELSNIIQEGMQVRVVCIPQMKVVLSINNIGLTHGARMTYPRDLEALTAPRQIPPQEAEREEEIHTIEATIDMSMKSDERLTKLKELRDKGLITEQDYENKKREILIEI